MKKRINVHVYTNVYSRFDYNSLKLFRKMQKTPWGVRNATFREWRQAWEGYWSQQVDYKCMQEKKEDILLSPMTKAPTPTEKSKKQRDNT